jgi:hypothetical protein
MDVSFVRTNVEQIEQAARTLQENRQKIALLEAQNRNIQAQIDWQRGVIAAHTGVVRVESSLTADDFKIIDGFIQHFKKSYPSNNSAPQCEVTAIALRLEQQMRVE